jgi:hypothetical protein
MQLAQVRNFDERAGVLRGGSVDEEIDTSLTRLGRWGPIATIFRSPLSRNLFRFGLASALILPWAIQ